MRNNSGIFEEYINSKYLKILTEEHLSIPGLKLFGRQIRTTATESLPPHDHGSCFEIVYICSGSPSFTVDKTTYSLSGGDIFVTQPHEVHSTNSIPVSVSEMYWMQLDFTAAENTLFLDSVAIHTLLGRLQNLPCRTISTDSKKTKDMIQNAFRIALNGSNPQFAAQYITLFLYLLLENSQKIGFRLTPDIGRAAVYILDNITATISLDELAAISYLSTSQFKQKFKQQMGISPRQFINQHKIQYAKELLQEGYSSSEAASALQFDSTSYFITVFKRYTSCTPTEYKRNTLRI